MDITINVKTKPESDDYLRIIHNDKIFSLDKFSKSYHVEENPFDLDSLFMSCSVLYKGKRTTAADMIKDIQEYSNKLKVSQLYKEKVYPFELNTFIIDKDYYAAGKLLKSAEDQLLFGRKALLDSYRILDLNVNLEWKHGYAPIYYQRCFNSSTAIIWYNNVFDSILQIIYKAFGIYKFHPNYSSSLTFHNVLRECDYRFLNKFYKENKKK